MTNSNWDQRVLSYPLFEGDFGDPGDRQLCDGFVVANKMHKCHHCQGPIVPKERHRVHVGVYDGQLMTFRYCSACCGAMAEYFSVGPDLMCNRFGLFGRKHED